MKNQYFGDINDYRKYGLLRALLAPSDLRLLVAWMLTRDDGRTDGRSTGYVTQPAIWERFDSELFTALRGFLASDQERRVDLIEGTSLLPRAQFFADLVPNRRNAREGWSQALSDAACGYDLVFLDPDNGLEVRSKPPGRAGSCKYVYWSEVENLWNRGSSLLIYQHFPRQKRSTFIPKLTAELARRTGASGVEAFRTPHVLFLLAAQDQHAEALRLGIESVHRRWEREIQPCGFWA